MRDAGDLPQIGRLQRRLHVVVHRFNPELRCPYTLM